MTHSVTAVRVVARGSSRSRARSPKTAGGNTFYLCNGTINSATGLCSGTVVSQFTTSKVGAIYQLAPGIATPLYRVLTTRPNYSQKYSGFELTATKRLSHKWMFRGNFSYNDYTESCGKDSFANPTPTVAGTSAAFGGPNACPGGQLAPASAGSGAFGNDFIGSKWNFNTTALYILPWDVNIGGSFSGRQGYASPLRDNITGFTRFALLGIGGLLVPLALLWMWMRRNRRATAAAEAHAVVEKGSR